MQRIHTIQIATILIYCLDVSNAQEKQIEEKRYPLWDVKEAVAKYAKRAGLEPEMTLDLSDGVKIEFVLIPAGKFVMGSPDNEVSRIRNEGPQHEVTISKPFYMGKFEVTQEQYEKLFKENPSEFKGARNPVESVSWHEARNICKQLAQKTGRTIRLPSEAEWEYACRAGSETQIHPAKDRVKAQPLTDKQRRRVAELIPKLGSDEFELREKATQELIALGKGILPILDEVKNDDPGIQERLTAVRLAFQPRTALDRVAWYAENSDNKPHSVGEKETNEFWLHDMHGNVCEMVEDDYHNDYLGAPKDGSAWVEKPRGKLRVLRGGDWLDSSTICRSAYRTSGTPGSRGFSVGFRVVCDDP
jgi:formylglycine-generating enzyme required for sulfatase activity